MDKPSPSVTLRDIASSIRRTLLALAVVCLSGEALVRAPLAAHLPAPGVGTPLRQLDLKLAALDARLAEQGVIDCIILGSSMPLLGLDPNPLADRLGVECFNFSLNGMSAAGAGALAHALLQRYRPTLLIYGVEMRAFAAIDSATQWRQLVIPRPWLQYARGQFTLEGWLLARSRFYGQLLAFSYWAEPLGEWWVTPTSLEDYDGFEPIDGQSIDVTQPLSEPELTQREIVASLRDYRILPEEWAGLEDLARAAAASGTRLVLVEMPVHESFLLYLGNGAADHAAFIQALEDFSTANEFLFVPSFGQVDLPPAVWADRNHLNRAGAQQFSAWLAARLKIQLPGAP
ncbi:MAG: hypothetical protein HYZ26_14485 [Chloroflexi bacterium]|nr:hypothetical protein [Chloroflexota bacterium]